MDQSAFELLKNTVAAMESINGAIKDLDGMSPARMLEPVLGEVDYDGLSPVAKAKFEELASNMIMHVRNVLESELDIKAEDIKQLKS